MFTTYILQSEKDGEHYIGWTDDLLIRLNVHNDGCVEATKNRRPFKLVYYEACRSKEKAIRREKYFKTGFGRRFIVSRI